MSIGAALLAALAASSCCLGPLLLAALGVGSAGAFAGVAALRPVMLVATAVFLGAGFYMSYRKPKVVQGASCGCDRPKARNVPRIFLWVGGFVTVMVAVTPPLLAKLSGHDVDGAPAGLETATIQVDGVDCEACAVPIRKALEGAGGVHSLRLDVSSKTVTVFYVPAPGRPDAYVRAIDDLGYEVSSSTDARKVAK